MANTQASGACARKGLEVQLLSWASVQIHKSLLKWPIHFALPTRLYSVFRPEITAISSPFQSQKNCVAFVSRLCYYTVRVVDSTGLTRLVRLL